MKMLGRIFLILTIFVLIISCTQKNAGKSQAKPIVKINESVYTTKDLWDFANITVWEMEPKDLENPAVQDKVLTDFISHKLLIEEAARRGYSVDDLAVDQFGMQLSTEEGAQELKAITGKYSIDAAKIALLEKERQLIDKLFNEVVIAAGYITEEELKVYYDSKDLTQAPVGQAHIQHIFTTDNESAHLAASELAAGLMFSEVARKYSESPEKGQGGDLGYVKETDLPEFFSAAFTLKEGEVSEIIKSEYGYHIFKMMQYAKASDSAYDNVKNTLLAELYTIKRQQTIGDFINELFNHADIQYLNNFTLSELFDTAG